MKLLVPHEEWWPEPDDPEFRLVVLLAAALAAAATAVTAWCFALLLSVIWRVLL